MMLNYTKKLPLKPAIGGLLRTREATEAKYRSMNLKATISLCVSAQLPSSGRTSNRTPDTLFSYSKKNMSWRLD